MKDTIFKYTVTSSTTNNIDFEFEGTAIDFAHRYADDIYGIRDIGYAREILVKYENLLSGSNFSKEHTKELEAKIRKIAEFDSDAIIYTNINHQEPLITSDLGLINPDFTIKIEQPKHSSVLQIESLGYSIQATSQQDHQSRLYLVEDGVRIGSVNFMSNKESIRNVRAKLAGEVTMRDNTYLSNALNTLYATALAHSTVNDRLDPDKIEALVSWLPNYLQKEYSDRIDKFGGEVKEEVKIEKAPEKEMFYLIHAKSLESTNVKPVNFTNEFVGTERDFNEYKATYGKNPTMKAEIVKIETFAPAFREAHRNIEKILLAYKAGAGDKAKMLDTLKSFDNEALLRLESRLKEDGLDPKKFESDMKGKPDNKPKPKM